MFGLPNLYVIGGVALAGLAIGAGGAWWVQSERIDGFKLQVEAANDKLATVTANRDALDTDNRMLSGIIANQQREADQIQAKADAALKSQQAQASQIRIELRDAKDQTATLIQQIQDARHARPVVVSQAFTDGFDPLIRAGLERLRCEQRAANRGEAPNGCRVPVQDAAGSAGAAGEPGGAGDYRPGFDTQLRMLNDLWRLHDWGRSCYRDKAAISASQELQP